MRLEAGQSFSFAISPLSTTICYFDGCVRASAAGVYAERWRKEGWTGWNSAAAGQKHDFSQFPALPGNPGLMDCWWVVDVVDDEWWTERTCWEVNSSALTCEELHYTSITSLTHSFFFPTGAAGQYRSCNNIIVANWTRVLIQSQPCAEIYHTTLQILQPS